jgi:hypothetical protein
MEGVERWAEPEAGGSFIVSTPLRLDLRNVALPTAGRVRCYNPAQLAGAKPAYAVVLLLGGCGHLADTELTNLRLFYLSMICWWAH